VRPARGQLTLAVALTADRLVRLDALAAAYRGGPVVAAVLVTSAAQAAGAVALWSRLPALRRAVDLQLFGPPAAPAGGGLPINALRNAALRLVATDFVALLDVDLLPSAAVACWAGPAAGARLERLLPPGGRRGLVLPMFIADVGVAVPRTKAEVLDQLAARVAAPYCLASQAGTAYDRWYRATAAAEARFVPGYEPYVALRVTDAGAYDERFVGYGFNKVAWTWAAAVRGLRLYVHPTAFVVHANHADNAWVARIDRGGYLMTWRRYLAYVAEEATAETRA